MRAVYVLLYASSLGHTRLQRAASEVLSEQAAPPLAAACLPGLYLSFKILRSVLVLVYSNLSKLDTGRVPCVQGAGKVSCADCRESQFRAR